MFVACNVLYEKVYLQEKNEGRKDSILEYSYICIFETLLWFYTSNGCVKHATVNCSTFLNPEWKASGVEKSSCEPQRFNACTSSLLICVLKYSMHLVMYLWNVLNTVCCLDKWNGACVEIIISHVPMATSTLSCRLYPQMVPVGMFETPVCE